MIFDNRFNSKKVDPLVEAARGAMKEGEIRRQAIAAVNEEFGVFNRNAVVRENLAAYDARIEEVFNGMKSGNLTEELSPKQKKMASLAGDPKKIDAADLASLRKGAKIDEKKGCYEEEQIDELKKPTPKTAMNAYYRAYDSDVRDGGEGKRSARLGRWKEKHLPGKSARNQKDTGKAELPDYSEKDSGYTATVKKSGKLTKSTEKATKAEIKSRLGKHTKPKHLPEETIEEAVSRKHFQQVADLIKGHESQEKRNELASHHASIFSKQNPRFNHEKFHAAAGSTAHQTKTVKESVMAAIRAKHMKEDDNDYKSIADKTPMKLGDTAAMDAVKKAGNPPLASTADPKGLGVAQDAVSWGKFMDKMDSDIKTARQGTTPTQASMNESVQVGANKYRIV